jgi:pyruvate/2-oxoglutarate/acetoin dehydrogenase E1 component
LTNTYLTSLNKALFRIFEADSRVYLFGQDLLDPYGGAFKVTKGLQAKFPDRVYTTPISEAGTTGVACGMAMRGFKPIVELMFGDFITLACDQIINHAAKFGQMYNHQVSIPLLIRTPMGGGRGYGATHSQSLEKIFLGIPGIKVIAPSHFHDPGALLENEIQRQVSPTLFIEHKLLYPKEIFKGSAELSIETRFDLEGYPVSCVRNFSEGNPDVMIISYGGNSILIETVLRKMAPEEIKILACFPALISSVPISVLKDLIEDCGNIILIEEGTGLFGWTSEVAAQLYYHFSDKIDRPIQRLCSLDSIIPSSKILESQVFPNEKNLIEIIEGLLI